MSEIDNLISKNILCTKIKHLPPKSGKIQFLNLVQDMPPIGPPRWIFCSVDRPRLKEKPKIVGDDGVYICYCSERVLFRDVNGNVYIGQFNSDNGAQGEFWDDDSCKIINNVTAWMPIPEIHQRDEANGS